jgi:hypothetical protein
MSQVLRPYLDVAAHSPAADSYAPNGVYADNVYHNLKGLKYRLSYQPAWDQHARMLQQLAASVPMAMVPGSESSPVVSQPGMMPQ